MENEARKGGDARGKGGEKVEEQARGAQKLTRESALCAVSEPEASPYCVSPRVAFVSVLVAPIVFYPRPTLSLTLSLSCLHPPTPLFCFDASSLSQISDSQRVSRKFVGR